MLVNENHNPYKIATPVNYALRYKLRCSVHS